MRAGRRSLLPLAAFALVLAGGCSERFDVDGARAHARVVKQVSFGPRIPGTPGHAAMRAWLEQELTRLGGRVEVLPDSDRTVDGPVPILNVAAAFGPAGGRRIALCAHWDTRPWSDEDPDSSRRGDPVPGANDGGSGVAVLFEVAELMSRRAPPIGVDLVFLDAEDLGRHDHPEQYSLGARAYARRLAAGPAERRPAAAFVFDMIGDRDLAIHPEVQSVERASNVADLVLQGARATSARHFHRNPKYLLTDDHVPFLDAGIPAVDIIDFDYPAWHTHRDLPDQVSPESLAEVSRVAAWLVYRSPIALGH